MYHPYENSWGRGSGLFADQLNWPKVPKLPPTFCFGFAINGGIGCNRPDRSASHQIRGHRGGSCLRWIPKERYAREAFAGHEG